ncbi:MAG: patatin-like phospholipase family protein [Saprospiraceae bacterium]|nr:patatin-like phospholipase family protein [Saprospiraceae bacterium]
MTKLKRFAAFIAAFLSLFSTLIAQERIMIVSGGGARGAWGGGLAKTLVTEFDYDYKVVVGASTGSLIAPFIALKEFDALKEGYTTINDKDIFNVKPYKTKGKKRGKIKGFQSFMRLMIGKKTLGESKRLKKTIRRFYTEEMFNKFKNEHNNRAHIATVVNLTKDSIEYKSSKDFEYEEMVDWIWASANAPIFMSLHRTKSDSIKKVTYVDGGVKEGVPLQKGIEIMCQDPSIKYIDVIVHSTLTPKEDDVKVGGVVKLLGRTIELFLSENRHNDLAAARRYEELQSDCALEDIDDLITITYYFMPESAYQILPNELLFREDEMRKLWAAGEDHIKEKQTNSELRKLRIELKVPRSQLCNSGGIWRPSIVSQ